LQSIDNPHLVFPVLEPKIFLPDYAVRLAALDLQELKLANLNDAAVLGILTIPGDVTQMTANLKAPIVINLTEQAAKQVVLQENDYTIKFPMFKELRAHLITIQSQTKIVAEVNEVHDSNKKGRTILRVRDITPSQVMKY